MDTQLLLKTLKYAKRSVIHPESRLNFQHIHTDGYCMPPTSAQIRSQLETRLKTIEEYEAFTKDVQELIAEIEITTNQR